MEIRSSGNVSSAPMSRRGLLRSAGLGALVVGSGSLLAACSGSGTTAGPSTAPGTGAGTGSGGLTSPAKFTIASAPGDNYFLDLVCRDKGFFEKHKLDVPDFVFPQSGVQAMQLFTGGAITGMQQDTLLTMLSYINGQEGQRPVIVGMRIPETTYSIVVNDGDWPDESASFEEKMQALKGKSIGVAAIGAGGDQQLLLALSAAGMKDTDVTRLAVGQFTAGVPQMTAGRIDAYVGLTYGTAYLMAQLTKGRVYIPFWDDSAPEILSKQQVQPIIVREDYLAENRAVVDAWKAAAWDGKEWMLANRDEAAKMLNETQFAGNGLEAAQMYIEHYARSTAPKINPDWKVGKEGIDTMIEVGSRLGMFKPEQMSYEQIVADFARM